MVCCVVCLESESTDLRPPLLNVDYCKSLHCNVKYITVQKVQEHTAKNVL